MKKYCSALSLAVVTWLLAACADDPTSPTFAVPKIDEIVQMAHDNVAPEEIVAVMRESHAVYDLSGSQLVRLHDRGVPDLVIDELLRAELQAARDEEWKRATARPVYWVDPSNGWLQQSSGFPYPSDPPPGTWHR